MANSKSQTEFASQQTPIVQSVATAFHLLETLWSMRGGTLSSLARSAGLSLNQTFRLLATLESAGYVVRNRDKNYFLGPKLHLLGQDAFWPHDLIAAAGPLMDKLSELTAETILLAVPLDTDRMIVDSRTSRHSLRVEYPLGSRIPLYVGGTGIAILAFSPQSVIDKVLELPRQRFTPHTLVSPEALLAELERTRKERVRVSRDDYSEGEFSLAAPILDSSGVARGALSVAGFTARLSDEVEEKYVKAVRGAGEKASRALQAPFGK
jgi:IclR family acetate operon transcriptional repressor